MTDTKPRAPRNRTLTLTPEEAELYLPTITTTTDIAQHGIQPDQIIQADLLAVIDQVPDASVDLIVIDPPYNLSKDFHGSTFRAMSDADYEAYLRTWLPQVCRKLAPHGSLYLCGDWRCSSAQQRVLSEHLTILNRITWQRDKGRGARRNWKNSMEDIWFAVRNPHHYHFDVDAVKVKRRVRAPYRVDGKPKDWEQTDQGRFRVTHPSNFWDDISIPFWSMPENTDHPTQKPEKLLAKLILASSRPGDLVFDPFMGAGTTCVTARKLGRRYLGIDINPTYCLWAAKRLALAESDPTIQGYSGGYFWERNSGLRSEE